MANEDQPSETQAVVLRAVEGANAPVPAKADRPNLAAMALLPANMQEAVTVSRLLAASGMFKHKTPEQAFAALLMGHELGLPPAAAMRAIDIIDGKPAPSADALVAACLRRHDLCEYFYCVEDSLTFSTWATRRVGAPAERRITYTLEDAGRAELTKKDVWRKYGNRMLGHRAAAFLAREVFPDIVMGMYSSSEQEEIAEERLGPARVALVAPELGAECRAALDRLAAAATLPDLEAMAGAASLAFPHDGPERRALGGAVRAMRSRLQHLARTGVPLGDESNGGL